MNYKTTLLIPDIGPVFFETSTRAKRLIISLKPFKTILVAIPRKVVLQDAFDAVLTKKPWILKQLVRLHAIEQEHLAAQEENHVPDMKKARTQLIRRLNELAELHDFSYDRVSIRSQKTRWGSCSATNNISLNIRLVLLPAELMDYVILHELVHTQIKNHGPAFQDELDRLVNGRSAAFKLEMHQHGARLLISL